MTSHTTISHQKALKWQIFLQLEKLFVRRFEFDFKFRYAALVRVQRPSPPPPLPYPTLSNVRNLFHAK